MEILILSVTAPPMPENILGIGSKRLKNRRILVTNFKIIKSNE